MSECVVERRNKRRWARVDRGVLQVAVGLLGVLGTSGCYLSHELSSGEGLEGATFDASFALDASVAGDASTPYDVVVVPLDAPPVVPEARCTLTGARTIRVSALESETGSPAQAASGGGVGSGFSPDGTRILFSSYSSTFVPNDTNASTDVFVMGLSDRSFGCVSTSSDGRVGDGHSLYGSFLPDGASVLFLSEAANLVDGDAAGTRDVFLKHLDTGSIRRVSMPFASWRPALAPVVSRDGASAALTVHVDDDPSRTQLVVLDVASGAVTAVSLTREAAWGDGSSLQPVFSPNGETLFFVSEATDLVAGDTNGQADVFSRDLTTGHTTRVSLSERGAQLDWPSIDPDISPDGDRLVFVSGASTVVRGDTNSSQDVFLRHLSTGVVERISVLPDGTEANAGSMRPRFSPDGRRVAFVSVASNFVQGDDNFAADVFVKDLDTGAVQLVSRSVTGGVGDRQSSAPMFSPGGTMVMFSSNASNLVEGAPQGRGNVFVACVD